MKPVIIGTAGHIDHGKTSLIKNLTGTDTDRFEEEKQRGMTIDIGFAFLGESIAFIDVPGHEKFIKNMVTGASTIDFAMLIIAADDGIMPQTREHFDILKILGVKAGLIVITKTDIVESEWLEMVRQDVKQFTQNSFLEKAPIFDVSNSTGQGVDDLKHYLMELPKNFQRQSESGLFRMPVDRVFTIKGHGTVVTGTVISGNIKKSKLLETIPKQKILSIKAIQSGSHSVETGLPGMRLALNIPNTAKDSIKRGDVLATPGCYLPTNIITASVSLLDSAHPVTYNAPVRLHIGTGEYLARIRIIGADSILSGQSAIIQIITETKFSAGFRDKFILRSYSPQHTIGGGVVLDPFPVQKRKKNTEYATKLKTILNAPLEDWILFHLDEAAGHFAEKKYLRQKLSVSEDDTKPLFLKNSYILLYKEYVLLNKLADDYFQQTLQTIGRFHDNHPLRPGIQKTELMKQLALPDIYVDYILDKCLNEKKIVQTSQWLALSEFSVQLSAEQLSIFKKLTDSINKAGIQFPERKILETHFHSEIIDYGIHQNILIQLSGGFITHKDIIEWAKKILLDWFQKNDQINVSKIRQLWGTSRKFALPLIQYFDEIEFTHRNGDTRSLIRSTDKTV